MKHLLEYMSEGKMDKYITHHYPDDEVKSAVWDYVAGYTTGINKILRQGRKAPEVTDYLDKAFKDSGKIDVYRTVDWNYMNNLYGITKENIDSKEGEIFLSKAYMSTTNEFHSPWGNKWRDDELVMHITSNKNVPYIDINKMFPNNDEIDCSDQKEILLPRNLKMRFNSYSIVKGATKSSNKGTYILDMTII